ncbi:MAG: response regulator transcription factor [Acidimicrobiales bacterium]
MTIRVFIIDDHELLRAGLRAVLEREPDIDVTGEAATVQDGLVGIERCRPDVVLVDLVLPDGDGLEVCGAVSADTEGVRCLVLASRSDDEVLASVIRAGAAGFLLTHTPARELVRSVRVIAGGGSLIDPTVMARLLERLRAGRAAPSDASVLEQLSPQERRLLDLLAEGLTNRQVAARMGLAEKTVKNYVSNLLRKLDMNSRTEAAVFVTSLRAARPGPRRRSAGPASIV